MNFNSTTKLDYIMNALFEPYKEQVADVAKISNALVERKVISNPDEIVNDHIAFRTLGIGNLGIASFEKIFLHFGYKKMEYYFFEEKKLNAYWYAPPEPRFPRIFISELRVDDLHEEAQKVIRKYTSGITKDPVDDLNLDDVKEVSDFLYKNLWDVPTLSDYKTLAAHSEYAAWVIYNRYYLNHYTISVHELKNGYNTLEEFNDFLEKIGIQLNTSGGIIKTSKDGLLKQSSSVAKMMEATFAHGETFQVAGSYVEFAERLVLPEFQSAGANKLNATHRRDGFESANADKIFESTYDAQVNK